MKTRRQFLVRGIALTLASVARPLWADCSPTQSSIIGPYYLPNAPFKTNLAEADEPGERLEIHGRVLGRPNCMPLDNALLDVWQADARGHYYNVDPGSPNTPEHYRLRGRLRCDARGAYRFTTILPGAYRLRPEQFRPRHIHFTVTHPGFVPLTTQLYFSGDPYLDADPFVRPGQTTTLTRDPSAERGWIGEYDIVLDSKT